MPVDINAEANYDPDQKLREFANKDEPNEEPNDTKRRKMEGLVKSNIEAAQAKQKYYDEKFGASSCLHVGSTVLKKDFTRKKRKGGKLDYRWQGPTSSLQLLEKGFFN